MGSPFDTFSRRRFVALAGATSAAVLMRPGLSRAATSLKLTHPADTSHPVHTTTETMVKNVAERTGGEVQITLFPNNALGSPTETAQQVRAGAVDMIILNPANIEALSRTVGVVNIPYQFESYEHAHRTLDVTGRDWMAEQLAKAGFTWIANYEWGFRSLSNSVRPVNTPEDIEGMKLRVPPELAIKLAFEALGAQTQTIAFQEVYLALANKTVDGQDNPVGTTFAAKFYEVQKHIALTKHIYATVMLASNPKSWSKLTDEQRAIIQEEATAAGNDARAQVVRQEEDYLAKMEESGVAVTRPEIAPFQAQMEPAYAQLRSNIGDEAWETWKGFVEAAKTQS
ncbi:C4-dicarboxylate ABC transporter substrate-binding protein [Acuticoccus sediminis]|uniref:C4-dicarboxylate ABC transporter substrate-binding protein n=1 Tax=Acuticoccus sediminis TaxID=2184697 RepID=A0A8B2P1C4_9HYPH|nr:TRAP transporter substrate-binding protein [Acuticoccus sediminis]RAI02077.1 C4-dicarboxylate ABC transporter substrate-binding protein [Acuticoccus sediminis]